MMMPWWEALGYFLLIINIFIGGVIVFKERKSATSTWAWLMILFFLPYAGLILYLLFGREIKSSRWDTTYLSYTNKILKYQRREYREERFLEKAPALEKYKGMMGLHLHHHYSPLTFGNEVEIFTDGKEKFDALFKDIEAASSAVYVEYFGVEKDETGSRLLEILTQKAEEGVEVLLLYDGLGSYSLNKKFLHDFVKAGGEEQSFFPLRTAVSEATLNHRNHRKIVVIDQKIGYTGGFNVGDKYLKGNKKMGYWRDTHLKLIGSEVLLLTDLFLSDWNKGTKNKPKELHERTMPVVSEKGTALQIVPSGPDVRGDQIQQGFLKMIQMAESYIYIQTPYFIPSSSLLESLRVAAASGVKVRIMIPNKPDHMFVYWATSFYAGELLQEGAEIYIYEGGFLHAKTLVIDDNISTVGSTNMDIRSVSLNFELNVFMYGRKTAVELKNTFEEDMQSSRQLTWEEYTQRSRKVRIKEGLFRLLSPLL